MRKLAMILVLVLSACAVMPETPRESYYAAEVVYGQTAAAVLSAVNRGEIVPGTPSADAVSTALSAARAGLDSAWAAIQAGNDQLAINLINTALSLITDLEARYAK
jgi:hypothetical protein